VGKSLCFNLVVGGGCPGRQVSERGGGRCLGRTALGGGCNGGKGVVAGKPGGGVKWGGGGGVAV